MFASAADRVRSEIEARIVNGSMPPGAPLDESQLGAMFDVSRTPVREALLQLSTMGFVQIIPRSGIYVVLLSARDLASLYEVLAQLEGLVARLVIHRINEEQIATLRQLHATGKTAVDQGDVESFLAYNKAFHEALYYVCGNSFLVEQILLIRKRINPYRSPAADYAQHIGEFWAEHDALLNSILGKDAALALDLASSHVMKSGKDLFGSTDIAAGNLVFDTAYGGLPRVTIDFPRVPSAKFAPVA